jgi:hypothetical protein
MIQNEDSKLHRHISVYQLKELTKDADDNATSTEDHWNNLQACVKERIEDRKSKALEAALKVITDELNVSNNDLVVRAIAREHAFLHNELINATLQAVCDYRPTDGRISGIHQETAREYFIKKS